MAIRNKTFRAAVDGHVLGGHKYGVKRKVEGVLTRLQKTAVRDETQSVQWVLDTGIRRHNLCAMFIGQLECSQALREANRAEPGGQWPGRDYLGWLRKGKAGILRSGDQHPTMFILFDQNS